jgi:hypothetical protein
MVLYIIIIIFQKIKTIINYENKNIKMFQFLIIAVDEQIEKENVPVTRNLTKRIDCYNNSYNNKKPLKENDKRISTNINRNINNTYKTKPLKINDQRIHRNVNINNNLHPLLRKEQQCINTANLQKIPKTPMKKNDKRINIDKYADPIIIIDDTPNYYNFVGNYTSGYKYCLL